MPEFLAENNSCGQSILRLVSRGNAIIAELLRLKDYIPPVFKLETKQEQQKYADIILDFSYFRTSDAHDQKIDSNPDLQELDEQFRESYLEIITRFYLAFESIHTYVSDLNHFLEDLEEGLFIQQTLESVLLDGEGKQLMCEALFLYGVMLLVTDIHINGAIRERLLVCYLRYSGQRCHSGSNVDDVCKLLRSTGFANQAGAKRIPNYPEDYFKRIPINDTFVDIIIGRLRSDDIYNQILAYPLPEHRSIALSNQAAMLYVCLYFAPNILHNQTAKMREIVDKYFPDNWIISIYMGITVNLIEAWEPYRAAKTALSNTLDSSNIREYAVKYKESLDRLIPQTRNVLKEGALTEDKLLDNVNKVLNIARECNVTLRWLMLHTSVTTFHCEVTKKCKQVKEQVISDAKYQPLKLFELLLNTGQFELKIKEMFKHLLSEKTTKWDEYKKEAKDLITELADVFSGTKPLTRIDKNEKLQDWLTEIAKQIDSLAHESANASGRKIIQLIKALEEVEEFHQLETHLQVKQFLADTRQYLHQMIRTINIKEEVLITLQIIGDLSYAWNIIDSYTCIMQQGIKNEPSLVIKLRATFLKLASALEIPLLRINQGHSDDLVSVSQYYSNELVNYVKKVLQIIPETMFGILSRIIHLQTAVIKELPTRLEKDKMKDYAQFDERFEVAKLTHSISVFTEGMLTMDSTLVGVIRVEPRKLLEDGIRSELVHHLAKAFHDGLTFNPKAKGNELCLKLQSLSDIIDGYRRSFEYIQDYVNIHGLKIWQEEMSNIISAAVEQECDILTRKGPVDTATIWQSLGSVSHGDVPRYPPVHNVADCVSANFMGRLAREIIRVTDPKTTVYVEHTTTWYDYKSHKEILDLKFFSKISACVGPAGLTGLDRIYSFMIVTELQKFIGTLQKTVMKDKAWIEMLETLQKELSSATTIANPIKYYQGYTTRAIKVWPQILDWVLKVGHLQLLRSHIAYELNTSCKFNSKNLESSLRAINDSLLADIRAHFRDPVKYPYPKEELLYELSKYLDWAGIYNPYDKIYVTTKNVESFATIMFLFVIAQLPKLYYFKNIDGLLAKKVDQLDGLPFIVGIHTVLKQFHSEIGKKFLDYTGQFILSHTESSLSTGKSPDLAAEVVTAIKFLEIYCQFAGITRVQLSEHIPDPILSQYQFLSTKVP